MWDNQSAQTTVPNSVPQVARSERAYHDWILLLIHDLFTALEDGFAKVAAGQSLAEIQGWVLEEMATSLIRRSVQTAVQFSVTCAADNDSLPKLTRSQRVILTRISQTGDSATVAQELGISIKTVRTHVRDACARLQVSGRTAAIQKARELGLLP